MRSRKFILLSACILLAGALAAGFAARAVVLSRTGETFSAGVRNVPSVLGQTAEEVLFYPWSMYDIQPLSPIVSLLDETGQTAEEMAESFSSRFLAAFSLFGADFDELAAYSAVQYAIAGRNQSTLLFLKDFHARTGDGTPIFLSFALSESGPSTISYLVQPQNPDAITAEQQEQALERVKTDLKNILTSSKALEFMLSMANASDVSYDFFTDGSEVEYVTPSGELYILDNGMALLLAGYSELARTVSIDHASTALIVRLMANTADLFDPDATLDDILAQLDAYGLQVQIVSTPDQVIVLFTYSSAAMLGVYYDIQLGQYSGIGLSYQ